MEEAHRRASNFNEWGEVHWRLPCVSSDYIGLQVDMSGFMCVYYIELYYMYIYIYIHIIAACVYIYIYCICIDKLYMVEIRNKSWKMISSWSSNVSASPIPSLDVFPQKEEIWGLRI